VIMVAKSVDQYRYNCPTTLAQLYGHHSSVQQCGYMFFAVIESRAEQQQLKRHVPCYSVLPVMYE
jgi:hypothetical protein